MTTPDIRYLRYLVRLVPEREPFLADLRAALPTLEVVQDRERNAMETFLRALDRSGQDATVHLEDDSEPTRELEYKLQTIIAAHVDRVIQFFSLRKGDYALGSRDMQGNTFSMTQCFYLPPGYAAQLLTYIPEWPRRHVGPTATDWIIADWLHARKERYWLHVPSLVQHRQVRSVIDPRRSSRRQSPTFIP